jgi:hypothetical protein
MRLSSTAVTKKHQTCQMVFDCHDPALHISLYVSLPHCPHINKIHLYRITELRRQYGLLCSFLCRHTWKLLMTSKTVHNEQFAQFISGTVEHRQTICQCLLHLHMAESAMSVMYEVEYVQHVANNAPGILVLENHLHRPVKSFCLLNLEMPDIVVSLGFTFA